VPCRPGRSWVGAGHCWRSPRQKGGQACHFQRFRNRRASIWKNVPRVTSSVFDDACSYVPPWMLDGNLSAQVFPFQAESSRRIFVLPKVLRREAECQTNYSTRFALIFHSEFQSFTIQSYQFGQFQSLKLAELSSLLGTFLTSRTIPVFLMEIRRSRTAWEDDQNSALRSPKCGHNNTRWYSPHCGMSEVRTYQMVLSSLDPLCLEYPPPTPGTP